MLTNLEEVLNRDATGTERARLIERLNTERLRLKTMLGRGVLPDEFSRLDALAQALESAALVLNEYSENVNQ